jgi:hypothetical protein
VTTENLDDDQESGRSLRDRLEAEIARNKEIATRLAQRVAQDFPHVSAEDLAGVSPDELETKAAELNQLKKQEREDILRSTLEERGLSGEQLDVAVQKLVSGDGSAVEAESSVDASTARVASLGKLQGTVPSASTDGLWGASKIRAAVSKN